MNQRAQTSQPLDARTESILYHALGADPDDGLSRLDEVFREAESNYALHTVDALLDLLADSTLHDQRLLAWRAYYRARKALLLWQINKAVQILDDIQDLHDRDVIRLQPRIELLRGEAQIRRGLWSAGQETIRRVIARAQPTQEPVLLVDAYEALARACISQAHSAGGWAIPQQGNLSSVLRPILTVALLPLYVPLLIGLWVAGAQPFWRPAVKFGAAYSNWPIFRSYLTAYWALDKARQMADQVDEERRFHLEMMWAGLLRDLTAFGEAQAAYQALLDDWPTPEDKYRRALVHHGLAKTLLAMGRRTPPADVVPKLETAKSAYAESGDLRAIAYVDLLLGDVDRLRRDDHSAAVRWKSAIKTFEDQGDRGGLAEGLGRCYAALDAGVPDAAQADMQDAIDAADRQVFTVRLPNRLFGVIQKLAWAMPLLVALLLIGVIAWESSASSREGYAAILSALVSWRNLALFVGILFSGMVANTLLGLIGLVSSLRAEATRLDFFELDAEGLTRFDSSGSRRVHFPWSAVRLFLRVERALFSSPTGVFTYDFLRTRDGRKTRLPGTTSWFKHLQRTVEQHVDRAPRLERLRWYGGAIFLYLGFFPVGLFVLTESTFRPWLSVVAHARLAVAFSVFSYLLIGGVIGRWVIHYTRVYRQTLPLPRFAVGACLLGFFLLLLGALGRQEVYPMAPLPVAWGALLLISLGGHLWRPGETKRRLVLARGLQGLGLVAGLALLVVTLLPILAHAQAYTYAGRLLELDSQEPSAAEERSDLFQRLQRAASWAVQWDPGFMQGYYYIGLAEYFQGNHTASAQAFSRALDLGTWEEVYHCRALAYYALGNVEDAEQDVQAFLERCRDCTSLAERVRNFMLGVEDFEDCEDCSEPFCQLYFPETEGTFDLTP